MGLALLSWWFACWWIDDFVFSGVGACFRVGLDWLLRVVFMFDYGVLFKGLSCWLWVCLLASCCLFLIGRVCCLFLLLASEFSLGCMVVSFRWVGLVACFVLFSGFVLVWVSFTCWFGCFYWVLCC